MGCAPRVDPAEERGGGGGVGRAMAPRRRRPPPASASLSREEAAAASLASTRSLLRQVIRQVHPDRFARWPEARARGAMGGASQ